jgi:hypothetical protein
VAGTQWSDFGSRDEGNYVSTQNVVIWVTGVFFLALDLADHSLPTKTEVKIAWCLTSTGSFKLEASLKQISPVYIHPE